MRRLGLYLWLAALLAGPARAQTDLASQATLLPAIRPAPEPKYDELSRKYDELQRQLNELSRPAGPAARAEPAQEVRVTLDDGLSFESLDRRHKLDVHYLIQSQFTGVSPASAESPGGFVIPRHRLYFEGHVLEDYNYYVVFQQAYGNFVKPDFPVELLDVYIELNYDERCKLRFGHWRSPFLYEMYKLPEDKLISTERSVVNNTVIPERQTGICLLGELFDRRVEYAFGLFNGANHVFYDTNVSKDFIGYIDYRPWIADETDHPFKHLHLVGSVDFGQQDTPAPVPLYRLNSELDNQAEGAASLVSPAFLKFSNGTTLRGGRLLTGFEVVWFYDGLTLLAGVYNGWQHYAPPNALTSVRAPVNGFSTSLTYFLTGEKPTSRDEIRPLRNFELKDPLGSPGAWELFGRYAYLDVGRQLIDSGAAVAAESTSRVGVLDAGAIWYLNQFTACWFAWQHSRLGNLISLDDGRTTSRYDLFSVRMQFFY
jgi:phosphate-selective porin OprO/OprP